MDQQIPSLQVLGQIGDQDGDAQDRAQTGTIRSAIFMPDHVLFRLGDARDYAYLIDSGEVALIGTDGNTLCKLGPGEIFGEMALIDGGERTATAMTTMTSDIFIIPRAALQDRVHGIDPILSLLIALLIERYRVARIHLPESIQQDQDQSDDLVSRLEMHNRLPDDLAGLSDIRSQKAGALKELKLEQELRQGLERNEFVPAFQPIVSLPDRKIIGFESLIRWNHPDKGWIYPDTFIPVAERTGVVQDLDKMMLQDACRRIPEFMKTAAGQVHENFFVSVNLSATNFESSEIIYSVREALIETGVEPHHLKLEITESALVSDPKKAERLLHGLRALGVTIALDDFGTGYSSMGYLHRFPIDVLKIDRSFVSQIHESAKSLNIVRAIVGLARNFNLGIVAEGIETTQDLDILNALGCDMGQGYLFGKPMSIDDAHAFMKKNLGL